MKRIQSIIVNYVDKHRWMLYPIATVVLPLFSPFILIGMIAGLIDRLPLFSNIRGAYEMGYGWTSEK